MVWFPFLTLFFISPSSFSFSFLPHTSHPLLYFPLFFLRPTFASLSLTLFLPCFTSIIHLPFPSFLPLSLLVFLYSYLTSHVFLYFNFTPFSISLYFPYSSNSPSPFLPSFLPLVSPPFLSSPSRCYVCGEGGRVTLALD